MATSYSSLEEAFGDNFNKKNKDELTFDVTTMCGKKYGFVTIDANAKNMEFSNSKNVLTKFEWEVCPQSSGSSEKPYKGTVTDTNVSSFVFPISNTLNDYFVQVHPYYNVIEDEWKERRFHPFNPNDPIGLQENSCEPPTKKQKIDSDCETQNPFLSSNFISRSIEKRTTTCVKGERMFAIFYTSKIMKKEKSEPPFKFPIRMQKYEDLNGFTEPFRTCKGKNIPHQLRQEPKTPNVTVSPWMQCPWTSAIPEYPKEREASEYTPNIPKFSINSASAFKPVNFCKSVPKPFDKYEDCPSTPFTHLDDCIKKSCDYL